jgi:hypothetical protein
MVHEEGMVTSSLWSRFGKASPTVVQRTNCSIVTGELMVFSSCCSLLLASFFCFFLLSTALRQQVC